MKNDNIVHIIGTGTVGEPLIGLLAELKKDLGIDELTFSKYTPRMIDRTKVMNLIKRGAKLCVNKNKEKKFRELGLEPDYYFEDAISRASVVIDCTPSGLKNKKRYYKKYENHVKCFVAQGSEYGFGKMYALGINDKSLTPDDKYVQVVSCNTHNIAVLIRTLAMTEDSSHLVQGKFLCFRRASDISQKDGFIPSTKVDKHLSSTFGSHHARDVYRLFKTIGFDLNVFSSAIKSNTQYMHSIWFDLLLSKNTDKNEINMLIEKNRRIAVTYKNMASTIFSFGRDHGYYGRIFNQTVIVLPTLVVRNRKEIIGFCFTPQDGNSILSSVATIEHVLFPEVWEDMMRVLDPYLFNEI